MGWMTGMYSRREVIEDVTRGWDAKSEDGTVRMTTRCLRKFFSGNDMWSLWEHAYLDGSKPTERFIVLHMIRCWGRGDGRIWGYKDVSEDMGPNQTNCPLAFVNAATEPLNDYSREWREKVRAHNAVFRVGNRVRLWKNTGEIDQATIVSVRPFRLRTVEGGAPFRARKSLVAGLVEEPAVTAGGAS